MKTLVTAAFILSVSGTAIAHSDNPFEGDDGRPVGASTTWSQPAIGSSQGDELSRLFEGDDGRPVSAYSTMGQPEIGSSSGSALDSILDKYQSYFVHVPGEG